MRARCRARLFVSAVLGAALIGPLSAQSADRPDSAGGRPPSASGLPAAPAAAVTARRASQLIGTRVRDVDGVDVGEIQDVVVDVARARVLYAIVGRDVALGLDEVSVAVPFALLHAGRRGAALALDLTAHHLESAPRFSRNLAEWYHPRYWDKIHDYYHRTLGLPARPGQDAVTADPRFLRGTDLLGMDVLGARGDEIGEVEDLVVELKDGSIAYAVLEFDRAWNPVDRLVALPMAAFAPVRERDYLTIRLTREQVARAPAFDRRAWPDPADRGFSDRVTGMAGLSRRDATLAMDRSKEGSLFYRLDTDRNGRLTRDEASALPELHREWDGVDLNQDGYVSVQEFSFYRARLETKPGR